MSLFDLFKSKKAKRLEQIEKALINGEIRNTNDVVRYITGLNKNLPLDKDSHLEKYISEGYENNIDVFGILMKLAVKAANVPLRLYEIDRMGNKKEIYQHEVLRLLKKPNFYQNQREFRTLWHLFYYTTGNAIAYTPRYKAGINKGKIDRDGLMLLPTQYTEIISGGRKKPIEYYEIDLNERLRIDAYNIWHERYPSLDYRDGKNFMGTSPLKVAMNVVNLQNAGMENAAKLNKNGAPIGILNKKDMEYQEAEEMESNFRRKYKSKYQRDISIPMLMNGEVQYIQIGFNNLKDLQILEMDKNGTLKICRGLNVPAELFGVGQKTYNNVMEAKKDMWEDRLKPDVERFADGITQEILPAYGDNLVLEPDFSGIEALQPDRERLAKTYEVAIRNGMATPNDGAKALGLETSDEPAADQRYIQSGLLPISYDVEDEMNVQDNDKFYNNLGLPNGL